MRTNWKKYSAIYRRNTVLRVDATVRYRALIHNLIYVCLVFLITDPKLSVLILKECVHQCIVLRASKHQLPFQKLKF